MFVSRQGAKTQVKSIIKHQLISMKKMYEWIFSKLS